ncbi:hypothetical protein FAUST_4228 [Fusarium austroamericanum]|uniref:Uncharacterized protein n=1 Tax=Fusarium austroamericanum TaxID=282268 RepID=A0AAN6C3C7_FUSAU|nr:hypothetical protein FAUST_4228 [Fusarium austroamericanum]
MGFDTAHANMSDEGHEGDRIALQDILNEIDVTTRAGIDMHMCCSKAMFLKDPNLMRTTSQLERERKRDARETLVVMNY